MPSKKAAAKRKGSKKTAKKKMAGRPSARKAKKVTKRKATRKKSAAKKRVTKKRASKKRKITKKKASKKAAKKKTTKKKTTRAGKSKATSKGSRKKVTSKKTAAKKAAKKPSKKKSARATQRSSTKASPSTRAARPATKSKKKTATRKPSTKRKPTAARANALSGPVPGFAPYQPKRNEDYMSDEQLEHFRGILMAWKRELMEEVDRTMHHMKDDASNPPDPNDRATQETEFGLELRTRDRERKLLKKIESALDRIDDGSYGYCEETGEEIGLRRLEARPVATLCVEAQERRELAEKQFRDREDYYR